MTGYMPHIDTRDMYKMHSLALPFRPHFGRFRGQEGKILMGLGLGLQI